MDMRQIREYNSYNRDNIMLSRYTGNCNVCYKSMPVGTEIAYGGKKGCARHVGCVMRGTGANLI